MPKDSSTRFPPIKDALKEVKHEDTPITSYRRLQPPSVHKLQEVKSVPEDIKCKTSLGRCLLNKLFNSAPVPPPAPAELAIESVESKLKSFRLENDEESLQNAINMTTDLSTIFSHNQEIISTQSYHKQLFDTICDLLQFTSINSDKTQYLRLRSNTLSLISTIILLPDYEDKASKNIPNRLITILLNSYSLRFSLDSNTLDNIIITLYCKSPKFHSVFIRTHSMIIYNYIHFNEGDTECISHMLTLTQSFYFDYLTHSITNNGEQFYQKFFLNLLSVEIDEIYEEVVATIERFLSFNRQLANITLVYLRKYFPRSNTDKATLFFDIFDSVLGFLIIPTDDSTIKAFADILFFAVKSDSIPIISRSLNCWLNPSFVQVASSVPDLFLYLQNLLSFQSQNHWSKDLRTLSFQALQAISGGNITVVQE